MSVLGFWKELPRPFYVLAPMEDVTDTVFRRLVAECGRPHVFFSEFTSVDGLLSPAADRISHRLHYLPEERPIVAQIWGNDPEKFHQTAVELRTRGFDGIDINMGCPVEKIVKGGCCSALIEDPQLAAEIFLATKEGAGDIPVSIKTRIGFRRKITEEWAECLLHLEPAVITVHGRIAKQLSKGLADWGEISKFAVKRDEMGKQTLIVGNGDVQNLEDADVRAANAGVDGVMIGRGIFDNLFLFNRHAVPLVERSVDEKLRLLLRHVEKFEGAWNGSKPFRILKKFFKIYVQGFPGASQARMRLVECETSDEVRNEVERILSSQKVEIQSSETHIG
ncbi:MAG: tRNA-dihydrouridine synthase [Bdellovibrionales bacterium]|nr:tRNA-dihydrouridine synthase [Bdellovibrionales bacterium]